jgi:hypothetical protein
MPLGIEAWGEFQSTIFLQILPITHYPLPNPDTTFHSAPAPRNDCTALPIAHRG